MTPRPRAPWKPQDIADHILNRRIEPPVHIVLYDYEAQVVSDLATAIGRDDLVECVLVDGYNGLMGLIWPMRLQPHGLPA